MHQHTETARRFSWPVLVMTCCWPVLGFQIEDPIKKWKDDPNFIRAQVRAYRQSHEVAILRELIDFLSIPNVASDRVNIRRNADHIISMLQRRGIETRLLEVEAGAPAVYGQRPAPQANQTIVFYAHYDGQPVDPTHWASDPWKPILRDGPLETGGKDISPSSLETPLDGQWRLYARSASDDKSPLVALLTALDALEAARIPLSVNLKFFLEGEEEAGSSHLDAVLQEYTDLLKADAWVFCDGPVHQTRRQQIVFGARGVMGLGITVYGPTRVLHSGHYGNWAPNPAVLLTHLLASMRDPDGQIRINGFYDHVRPMTDSERRALAEVPEVETELQRALGLARTEGNGQRLLERTMLPAMNLDGLLAANVGDKARNAIPTEAHAAIDFRLVPDQTPQRVRELVETHIRKQGFHIVYDTPPLAIRLAHAKIVRLQWEKGYPAVRTSMDLPLSQALIRALEDGLGHPVIKVPMLGGSLPMYLFRDALRVPLIIVPMVNHDNNQHASNENLRLQNLWDGIEMYAGLLARLGHSF